MSACGFRLCLVLAGIWILLLAGCQIESPPPQTAPDAGSPPVGEPSAMPAPAAAAAVQRLLERARLAFDAHHLTSPAENSAFALYGEVLRLDPGNDDARWGLEKIVERYVRFALEAIERRQFPRARSMLARARLVDASHPAIEPTEQQLRLLENAKRDRMQLDPEALAQRSAALESALRNLGVRAKASSCQVTINARSDAEGRWIYRQLNSASGETRVRASLEIASPPSVELICLPPPG